MWINWLSIVKLAKLLIKLWLIFIHSDCPIVVPILLLKLSNCSVVDWALLAMKKKTWTKSFQRRPWISTKFLGNLDFIQDLNSECSCFFQFGSCIFSCKEEIGFAGNTSCHFCACGFNPFFPDFSGLGEGPGNAENFTFKKGIPEPFKASWFRGLTPSSKRSLIQSTLFWSWKKWVWWNYKFFFR